MILRTAIRMASRYHGPKLSIFIFHRVLDAPDPLFPGELDVARFDAVVRWINAWFDVLPLAEAVERMRDGRLAAGAACITFDDGYADNLTNAAPILARHGAHGTFFIATDFIDGGRMWNDGVIDSVRNTHRDEIDADWLGLGHLSLGSVDARRSALEKIIPALKHLPGSQRSEAVARMGECCQVRLSDNPMMSRMQLQELNQMGMGIGAHTCSHPILANTDPMRARDEMGQSREVLEALLGRRVGLFAYPNGKPGRDYHQAHVDMARALGYDAAVSTAWGASRPGDDLFQLRRFTPWDRTPARFGARIVRNLMGSV